MFDKIKWLMFSRVFTTAILLVATVLLQLSTPAGEKNQTIAVLYWFVVAVFVLSCTYAYLLQRIRQLETLAYLQVGVDVCLVTVIVYVTGGYYSIFTFLYLVVIISASMILYLNGGVIIASWSGFQYGALVFSEYLGLIPAAMNGDMATDQLQWTHLLFKIAMIWLACYAVALLTGVLTEQNRKTQKELQDMEVHVRRVEKMASMGEMAAGLAHEIKNPLASLSGSIQMLKEELHYDAGHAKLMEIVLRETDRLSSLVNEFLFFARPPAGKPEKVDLQTAIEEIVCLFEKDHTSGSKIQVIKALMSGVWVEIDAMHLRQVLWNLLLNAAEAISDTGTVQIRMQDGKSGFVDIQVADDGCGIPDSVVNAIFDPFYTTKPEGTGLGLSIVHRILETYHSRLMVDTQNGEGTTMTFRLRKL